MREAAAKVADDLAKTFDYESHPEHPGTLYNAGFTRACRSIATSIRALPLPEAPKDEREALIEILRQQVPSVYFTANALLQAGWRRK